MAEHRRGLLGLLKDYAEVLVSVAALVTAVAAVVITIEQTKVMREEAELERRNARISVMPSVWVGTHIGDTAGDAHFKIVLTNKGLGPAVIERVDVNYKGEPVGNWDALARKMAADIGSAKDFQGGVLLSSRSPVSPGLMLEAGGDAVPLNVVESGDLEGLKLLMRGAPYLQVTVCYCSLYGDCFQAELFRRPEKVVACEAADKPFISHGFFRN
jgi:hypothetical protein